MNRAEAHAAVDRLFDRLDADEREPLGMALAVPHSGMRPGIAHTTIETDYETLHHERCVTVLAGAAHALVVAVDEQATRTRFEFDAAPPALYQIDEASETLALDDLRTAYNFAEDVLAGAARLAVGEVLTVNEGPGRLTWTLRRVS